MWRHRRSSVEKEFFETVRPSSLLKRFASIEEIASLVIFMASPLYAAINGVALRVDGGVIRSIIGKKSVFFLPEYHVELQLSAVARVVLFVIAALLPVVIH
jgi:Enoyl-(Acyl carrier protein) reductase